MSRIPDRHHRCRTSRAILAVGLSLALGASAVAGEPQPAPSQAKRDLLAGQKLLKKGQFDEALAKLRASYVAEPSGAALMGMGEAERQLDHPAEAYRDYEKALSDPSGDLQPADREAAQRALGELAGLSGTVKVTLSETGAACTLDGRALGLDEVGHSLRLSAGRHVLEASKPGFETLTFPVWVTAGKELVTTLTLKPAAGAPPAAAPAPPPSRPPSAPAPTSPPPPAVTPPLPAVPPPAPPPLAPTAPPASPAPSAPPPPPATIAPPPPPSPVTPMAVSPPPVATAPPPPIAQLPASQPAGPPLAPGPVPSLPPPASAPPPAENPPSPVTPLPSPTPDFAPLPSTSEPPLPTSPAPAPPSPASAEAVRLGFLVGILAFPRPIEGEVVIKLGTSLALGLKGGYLPELSTPGGSAKLDLKAVEGTLRWFPGQGVFFLGAGLGYQSLLASLSEPVDYGQLTIAANMSGFFVSPQIGVLWISQSGFAMSFSVGAQVPIPRDPVVSATYNGQPVPTQPTSAVPQDVVNQAHSNEDSVRSLARLIVKYPFPNIDLLRIGFFF